MPITKEEYYQKLADLKEVYQKRYREQLIEGGVLRDQQSPKAKEIKKTLLAEYYKDAEKVRVELEGDET